MTTSNDTEYLQGRIRDLESALMIGTGSRSVAATFLLPPRLADIFGMLISQPVVTAETIQHRLELVSDAKVAIWRLRKHMAQYGITIQSRNRVGYWLDDENKAKVKRIIAEKAAPADEPVTSEVSAAA